MGADMPPETEKDVEQEQQQPLMASAPGKEVEEKESSPSLSASLSSFHSSLIERYENQRSWRLTLLQVRIGAR